MSRKAGGWWWCWEAAICLREFVPRASLSICESQLLQGQEPSEIHLHDSLLVIPKSSGLGGSYSATLQELGEAFFGVPIPVDHQRVSSKCLTYFTSDSALGKTNEVLRNMAPQALERGCPNRRGAESESDTRGCIPETHIGGIF